MFDIKSKLWIMRNKFINFKILNSKIDKKIGDNFEKKEVINNIRKDIIDVKFNDNLIIIDIKEECKFFDYSYTVDNCFSQLRDIFIPMKIFITNGGNIFDYKLFKQKIYIFKNNRFDYMIAVSDNIVRISMRKVEDLIYETELDYKINENKYTIYKLVHDLNHSTKCLKWYPEEDNVFYLNKEEAKEMAIILFNNLDGIENVRDMVNKFDEIKNYVKSSFSENLINNNKNIKCEKSKVLKISDYK